MICSVGRTIDGFAMTGLVIFPRYYKISPRYFHIPRVVVSDIKSWIARTSNRNFTPMNAGSQYSISLNMEIPPFSEVQRGEAQRAIIIDHSLLSEVQHYRLIVSKRWKQGYKLTI